MLPKYQLLFDADDGGASGGSGSGGEDPSPADPSPAGGNDSVPGSWDEIFQHPRFKGLNERAKTAEARAKQLEEAEKARKDKETADQGKWKDLAEQREAELKQERLNRLKLTVATKKGIPVDLVDRLQGDDEAALEKDADKMLQFLKPDEGPGVPPAGKGGGSKPLDMSKMTPAQIREKAHDLWEQEVTS